MTSRHISPDDLAEQVRKDLKSAQGKRAVKEALARSSQINKEMSREAWLDPKKLDEPITD